MFYAHTFVAGGAGLAGDCVTSGPIGICAILPCSGADEQKEPSGPQGGSGEPGFPIALPAVVRKLINAVAGDRSHL